MSKCFLKRSKLAAFNYWLLRHKWELQPTAQDEVVRAIRKGRTKPLIIRQKNHLEPDLAVLGRDKVIVNQYLRESGGA